MDFGGPFLKLLGFNFGNNSVTKVVPKEERSPVTPPNDDGAVTIQSTPYYGTYVDLEGSVRNEVELITRYRDMSLQPELEQAIDEVVDESIQEDDDGDVVELDLDRLDDEGISEGTKDKIQDEFDEILRLLSWRRNAYETFRRWYIDGRINYHVIVNSKDAQSGIKELRYIDPRRLRKFREIQKEKDPLTGAEVIVKINEYYIYSEKVSLQNSISNAIGIKIAPESIVQVNSSLMDPRANMVLSYLHKAIKPLNNLRMIEDAVVIYRLSRAPERRVFYIDIAGMPTAKGNQYLYDTMMKYRNKLVYDASTGEVRDDRKHLNMMEDYWIPRKGEKNTEITTLQSGQNLSRIEDAEFFQKKLYRALGIPIGRLNLEGNAPSIAGIGRTTEVTREELKFAKFIDRIRAKFQMLFLEALGIQLRLKGICNDEEWQTIQELIDFTWVKSNNYDELLEGDVLRERLLTLQQVDPYVGRYYSVKWVKKNILKQTDEEIEEMTAEMEEEQAAGDPAMINAQAQSPMGAGGAPGQPGMAGGGLPLVPDTAPKPGQLPGINQPGGPVTEPSIPGAPTFGAKGEDNTGIARDIERDDAKSIQTSKKKPQSGKDDREDAKVTGKDKRKKLKKRLVKRMKDKEKKKL
jgi:hypothetical protein